VAVARSGSATGLSPLAAELEETALACAAAYGLSAALPFSAFGESLFLLAQNTVLLAMIYWLTGARVRGAAAFAALAAAARFLLSPALTPLLARRLLDGVGAIMLAARLPQIGANARARSTGQLSLVTYAANTAGSLARVLTSVTQGGGGTMVRNYVLSAVLNGVVVAQILAFRPAQGKKKGKGKGAAATPARRSARAKAA
jgi:mannose-P-dolichol utilization defect protein 1